MIKMDELTSISISKINRDRIKVIGHKGDSYDTVIGILLTEYENNQMRKDRKETINTLVEWQMINETEKGLKPSEDLLEGFDAVCSESKEMYEPTSVQNINHNISIIVNDIFDGYGIDDRRCSILLQTILRADEEVIERLKANLSKTK